MLFKKDNNRPIRFKENVRTHNRNPANPDDRPAATEESLQIMHKVIFIVIDGCRPDGIQAARTPHLDHLIGRGAHTFTMQSVFPPITHPAHVSIFTSIAPVTHGVLTNAGRPDPSAGAFSLLDLAKYGGKTVSGFFSWDHFTTLAAPGTFDFLVCSATAGRDDNDLIIMRHAIRHIVAEQPDFSFIYLEHTDKTGHRHGYMSPEYLKAIETADTAIGNLAAAFDQAHLHDTYHIIIQSDHGGIDFDHNRIVPEVMNVPWITAGPCIKNGHAITAPTSILDTAPTIARLLEIPPHPFWQGKVIDEALR